MSITWITPFVARTSAVTTGAAVEGQLPVLQRERDRLALDGLDGAVLPCDCDRLSALDVAGDDVVGEHLREQRRVGEDGRVGCRRRRRELRERLVRRREDGERAGAEIASTRPAFWTSETSVEKSGLAEAIWTIDCVAAGGCDSDGGTSTVSMAWITPLEAFTSGTTTRAVPLRTILPPLKRSAIDSRWTVLTFPRFLAAATAAEAGMRVPTT